MAGSGDNNDGMGFHTRDERDVNCQSSGMSTGPFFPSTWDPVVSVSHHENYVASSIASQSEFNGSPYTVALENHGIPSTSAFAHYPSDSSFVEMLPKFPAFESGSLSEIVGSIGLTDSSQIGCPPNNTSNRESNRGSSVPSSAQNQENHQFSAGNTTLGLPYGKKRKCSLPDQDTEAMVQNNSSAEISDVPKEQAEKKQTLEKNSSDAILKSKVKQAKDNGCRGEAPKEDYIHVRARKGQATNSHSLAERVRREKISERMRMLQELVPGCNKITGKAVMLDEIINYVQSLQQQVEFLSMKLATFSPELNIDIERILSKDILHSRDGTAAPLGFNPGMNSQSYAQHGLSTASIRVIPNTNHQMHPSTPHPPLHNDFQTLVQTGFSSSSGVDILGANGRLKPEL